MLEPDCQLLADAMRFRSLVEFASVSLNKWIVQAIREMPKGENGERRSDEWSTSYFAIPPNGIPRTLQPSKLDALRAAIDSANAHPILHQDSSLQSSPSPTTEDASP
jgi:hypothetical protein